MVAWFWDSHCQKCCVASMFVSYVCNNNLSIGPRTCFSHSKNSHDAYSSSSKQESCSFNKITITLLDIQWQSHIIGWAPKILIYIYIYVCYINLLTCG